MKKYFTIICCAVVLMSLTALNSCKKDKVEEKTPTAGFSYSPSTIYTSTTVYFTNYSENAANYRWSFGDGQTSNSINPTHSYSTSGYKTVELTAYSESGAKTNSITKSLYVEEQKGDVMFWTDASTQYNITVTFRGTNKTITYYYTSTPSYCGASGCATYWDVEPGTYHFTASNLLYEWDGYVTISSDVCTKMLLYANKGKKQTDPESQSQEMLTLGNDAE